jgi:hypothetical protein
MPAIGGKASPSLTFNGVAAPPIAGMARSYRWINKTPECIKSQREFWMNRASAVGCMPRGKTSSQLFLSRTDVNVTYGDYSLHVFCGAGK